MPSHETAGLLHEVRHLFDDTRRLDEEIADLVHGSPPFALVVPLQLPPHAREVRGRVRPQLRKQDHNPPDTLSPGEPVSRMGSGSRRAIVAPSSG